MIAAEQIKIISIDLDGTLFKSDGTVEERTIEALLKCKSNGIQLVFNTARPKKMIPNFLLSAFPDEFWILSNGTTCLKNESEIFHFTMQLKHIKRIIKKLHHEHNHFFFSIESNGKIYTTSTCEDTNLKYYAEPQTFDFITKQSINKIIIIAEERNFPVEQLSPLINKKLRLLVTEQGKYVQIMPRAISKLSAVLSILETLNLDLSNLLSFGDDMNDVELLMASKIGVAMGNADKKIKHLADYITTSNDRDGVGEFINAFFRF